MRNNKRNVRLVAITIVLLCLAALSPSPSLVVSQSQGLRISWSPLYAATDVTLQWDPNTETDLAGYKVYWGTASRTYTGSVDVGNVTTYTVKGRPDGTSFFAATAYDKYGNQSDYSNEVSITLDSTPPTYPKNLKAVSIKATIATSSGSITTTVTTGQ